MMNEDAEEVLASVLTAVRQGGEAVDLHGVHLGEEGAKKLASALESTDNPIEWKLVHAIHGHEDNPGFLKHQEAVQQECGYLWSELANVVSLTVRLAGSVLNKRAAFGLTTDPDDGTAYSGGFGIRLFPAGLRLADGSLLQKPDYVPRDDIMELKIRDGHVELYRNSKRLEVLGPTERRSMHAKVCIYELGLLVRVVHAVTTCMVSRINLRGCNIGDRGADLLAKALKGTDYVTALDVSQNLITDPGTTSLAESLEGKRCQIVDLQLSHNGVSDTGVARLSEVLVLEACVVTTLDLSDNRIGDVGATALAQAISQEACAVTHLALSLNKIGSLGVEALAAALELETCKVTRVDLGLNKPCKQGRKRLAAAFASTPRLQVC